MTVHEIKQIISSIEISEDVLKRINEVLAAKVDEEELDEKNLDLLISLIEVDTDMDKLQLKSCKLAAEEVGAFRGKINTASRLAGDEVDETMKAIYEETNSQPNQKSDLL